MADVLERDGAPLERLADTAASLFGRLDGRVAELVIHERAQCGDAFSECYITITTANGAFCETHNAGQGVARGGQDGD